MTLVRVDTLLMTAPVMRLMVPVHRIDRIWMLSSGYLRVIFASQLEGLSLPGHMGSLLGELIYVLCSLAVTAAVHSASG